MKSNIRILIVDDDRAAATAVGEIVTRAGFNPVIAHQAGDALNMAKLQAVDAAILDVMLPKMSGVQLAIELRATKFGAAPILLVSGVFRDKAFAAEALAKTGASAFLNKPYAVNEIHAWFKEALALQLSGERWDLPALLVRQLKSERDFTKAIEELERIDGRDFPFVLSLLMEAKATGHLNLVSEGGEIFGITLSRGTIAEVDSADSRAIGTTSLVDHGFLASAELSAFTETAKRNFPLELLVSEGLVSPHAVGVAKNEQILAEFRAICATNGLQLNFNRQKEYGDPPKHAVSIDQLMRIYGEAMDEFFPVAHLAEFYEPILTIPMHPSPPAADLEKVFALPMFNHIPKLRACLDEGGTLARALEEDPERRDQVLVALHFLVLSRNVIFDDVKRAKTISATFERYQDLFAKIRDLPADQVFEYFGAGPTAAPATIEKIFAEYVRTNSPSALPKEATPETIELAERCMAAVEAARVAMTDETQRRQLSANRREVGTQRQRKASELVARALEHLLKDDFAKANDLLQEAAALHPGPLQFMLTTWAEVKAGQLSGKSPLSLRLKALDKLGSEDKKSAYYHLAVGLVKRAQGDPNAGQSFERALEMDSSLQPARRELAAHPAPAKPKKMDILNGDITGIVSNLFRRKAE